MNLRIGVAVDFELYTAENFWVLSKKEVLDEEFCYAGIMVFITNADINCRFFIYNQ